MRLRQFAEGLGISYSTALRMFRRNEIPGAYKLPSGTIVVPEGAIDILGNPTPLCDENLIGAMELIEEASRVVLGTDDASDLMQLIRHVLLEYGGEVTYDSD